MRQALLLIKVALFLASLVSFNGAYAESSGQYDLVAQTSDIAFSSSPSNGDDKKAILPVTPLPLSAVLVEPSVTRKIPVFSEAKATRPFARAPPVTPRR